MIKAQLSDGTLILGLSWENVERLKQGRPIRFDGRPIGFKADVLICYGETEDAIAQEILAASGVRGSG